MAKKILDFGQQIGNAVTPREVTPMGNNPRQEAVAAASDSPRQAAVSKLGGWDKFKNFWAGAWNKVRGGLGLTGLPEAHVITTNDYVKDPKTGKVNFSW